MQVSEVMTRQVETVPAHTMEMLRRWSWPGNIRELENVIERAVILSPGSLLQVPESALQRPVAAVAREREPPPNGSIGSYREGEREMIIRALRDANGVVGGPNGAAARLGLKRTTLHSKMVKLGISRPSY